MTHTDGWSWFDAPELSDVDLSGHDVTAVLVCRNAESWLNATLAGIGQLDRRPDLIIAVDNQSSDDTAEILDAAYDAGLVDQIVQGIATASFGEAVQRALTAVENPTRWIWLLHDDAVPDSDALTELLTLAARTPRLAIAVPLLVRPSRRSHAARTLEVGATISGSGRRALGLEPDEVAQGQYESMSVLGGSTCGMLIRWESLTEVGGFDPCVKGYRDGVDLGWRVQLINQWVLTCPTARFVHRQTGRSEIRRGTLASQAGRSEIAWDRLMGLRLVGAHARGLARLLLLARVSVVCLVSALVYLLGRAPDHAKDELQAWADFVFRSQRPVARLRKKIANLPRGRDTSYRIRSLRPTIGNVIEEGFHTLGRWLHDQFAPSGDAEMTLDDLLGDEFTRRVGQGRRRIPSGVWFVLVVGGVALMARGLYRSGLVTASGLLGAPGSLTEAFQSALSQTGLSEPWLLVSAGLSVLSFHPIWMPVVLLMVAFPATMLVGVWFARQRIKHGTVRWLAAAGYALIPILMGGLNRGTVWMVVLAILLPFVAEWITRLDRPWAGARSLQPLAGLALAGVLIISISPVLWVPVVAVGLVMALYARGPRRVISAIVALVVPILFWAQALPAWVNEPARLLLTPEPQLNPAPLAWQMLFARPAAVGVPPLWLSIAVSSVVWIGALVIALRGSWRRWIVLSALIAIAVGMWLPHLRLTLGGVEVNVDASPWLLVGFGLLLFSFVSWLDHMLGSLEGRDFGGRQALVGLLSLLLVGAFLLAGGWSAYAGMASIHRGGDALIPRYLAQNEIELDTATLVIDTQNYTWNIRSQGQTFWGQGTFASGPAASEDAVAIMEQIVARALAGRSDDAVGNELAEFGVSSVVVLHPSPDTIAALDATSGLQRSTASGEIDIWSVTLGADVQASAVPTRRALVTPGTPAIYLGTHDEVEPGSPRTLVLAIPPDPNLRVFVGDTQAQPTASEDWRASYSLGQATGPIRFERTTENEWVAWLQFGVVVLLIVFVFPPLSDQVSESPRYQLRSNR